MTLVIDSSAIIAILQDESDARSLASCLEQAASCIMSTATFMECGTVMAHKFGKAGLRDLRTLIELLETELVPVSREHAEIGMAAYERYGRGSGHPARLNYGDCFSYALAKARNLPLLFKGDDFIHTDVVPALKPA
jgi:ribonuclease VapC